MEKRFVKKLMRCKTVDEFMTMFFEMSLQQKLSVLGDEILIPKDTILYRARKDEGTPLIKESDWDLPPEEKVERGRFNHPKKPVLYVSTMDSVLPREIGLKINDKYYLAQYKSIEDIRVGSLLKQDSTVTMLLDKLAMAVESDNKLMQNEKNELQKSRYEGNSLLNFIKDQNSVFYIYKYLHEDLYEYTNKIADLLIRENSNGFRYCSCYAPIELSGGHSVLTLSGEQDGNYVLTSQGKEKLKYIKAEGRCYTEQEYRNSELTMLIDVRSKVGKEIVY